MRCRTLWTNAYTSGITHTRRGLVEGGTEMAKAAFDCDHLGVVVRNSVRDHQGEEQLVRAEVVKGHGVVDSTALSASSALVRISADCGLARCVLNFAPVV